MKKWIFSLTIIALSTQTIGQTWITLAPDSTFGNSGIINTNRIVQLSDHSLILSGRSSHRIVQARLLGDGQLVDQDTFHRWPQPYFNGDLNDMKSSRNDNLFYCGTSSCCGPANQYFFSFVLKTNKSGEKIWQHDTGSLIDRKTFKRIFPTNNGGCLAIGDLSTKIILYQIDSLGNSIYEKHHWEPDSFYKLKDAIHNENQYLLLCEKKTYFPSADSTVLLSLNLSGDIVWRKAFRFTQFSYKVPNLIATDLEGNIWLIDQSPWAGAQGHTWIVKLDSNGNFLWENKIQDFPIVATGNRYFGKPVFTSDGSVILTAKEIYPDLTYGYGIAFKVDREGELKWKKEFHFVNKISDAVRTNNGGIVLLGKPQFGSHGGLLAWDMDENGNVIVNQHEQKAPPFHAIKIFPNPTNNSACIDFNLKKTTKVNIDIFASSGKRLNVFSKNKIYQKGKQNIKLNTAQLPSGIYWIAFKIGDELYFEKIIKQ